jgi:hypothetical protein
VRRTASQRVNYTGTVATLVAMAAGSRQSWVDRDRFAGEQNALEGRFRDLSRGVLRDVGGTVMDGAGHCQ